MRPSNCLPTQRFLFGPVAAALVAAALVVPSLGLADDSVKKPNFTGIWNMVKEKSDFGKFSSSTPDSIVQTIDHRNATVNVHVVQHRNKLNTISDIIYYTDGRQSINEANGRESKSHCFWDGTTLVIRSDSHLSNGDPSIAEIRWTLSPDKNTLTMASHVETDRIQENFTLVLERAKP
jgi:hypothetical protein